MIPAITVSLGCDQVIGLDRVIMMSKTIQLVFVNSLSRIILRLLYWVASTQRSTGNSLDSFGLT